MPPVADDRWCWRGVWVGVGLGALWLAVMCLTEPRERTTALVAELLLLASGALLLATAARAVWLRNGSAR